METTSEQQPIELEALSGPATVSTDQIIKIMDIIGKRIDKAPAREKGELYQRMNDLAKVINLRGRVIPVVDLRAKFGMETVEKTEQTCIIVVEIQREDSTTHIGIVVDSVSEVLDIAGESIEDTPEFGSDVEADFILGMGKIGKSVKILLDIDKVLATAGLSQI